MSWPPTLGPNGWVVDPLDPPAGGGGAQIEIVTEATLPEPSASNANTMYYVTDRRGGCLVISDGINNVESAPGLEDVSGIPTVTMAAAIAAGGAAGDLSYVTHASWNQPVLARHDGTRWRPFNGRQPLYRNTAAVTSGAAATSGTATSASVTLVGGMMGINGGFTVEVLAQLDGTPLTVTDGATLDATAFMSNTNNGTNQRRLWSKKVRNQNSASAQLVTTRSSGGDYGAEGTFGTTATTLSKNSANDLAVVVTEAFTSSGAQVMSILNLEIDWIG